MDLKKYKYINNTKQLPGFDTGLEKAAPHLIGGAAQALSGIATLNSLRYPTSKYFGTSGTTMNYVDGIGYKTYNPIDTTENRLSIEEQASRQNIQNILTGGSLGLGAGTSIGTGLGLALGGSGAAAGATAGAATGAATGLGLGAWAGPIGAVAGLGLGLLGGWLFGGDDEEEQKRQLAIEQRKQDNYNEDAQYGALTAALQKRQSEQYRSTTSDPLFSGKYGTEGINPATNETYKSFLVQTSHGPKVDKQNAWLDNGEWIESPDGSAEKIKGGSKKTDSVRGRIEPGDRVAASHVYLPGTKISMADIYPIARNEGWTDELFNMQANIKDDMKNKQKGLPGFAIGWENLISTIPGFMTSWNDYRNIKNDQVKETNIRPYNAYINYARNLLANRRANMNPVYQNILQNDAHSRYAINSSAGLGAGQKMLANIANSANTRRILANAILQGQEMDNKYSGEEAQFMGNMGNQIMNANLNAEQFNVQRNDMAHNAQIQGTNMAKRNMLDYLTQFGKNAWENKVFSDMYKLYAADVANRSKNNESAVVINNTPTFTLDDYMKQDGRGWDIPNNVKQFGNKFSNANWSDKYQQQYYADLLAKARIPQIKIKRRRR